MDRVPPPSRRAAFAVLVLSAATLGDTCRGRASGPGASPMAARPTEPVATFQDTVRPILAAKCAPCHNPGGKMYDRLPFDRPEVVSSHASGVRRRLKGDDLQALEKWLATLPPAKPGDEEWAEKPGG